MFRLSAVLMIFSFSAIFVFGQNQNNDFEIIPLIGNTNSPLYKGKFPMKVYFSVDPENNRVCLSQPSILQDYWRTAAGITLMGNDFTGKITDALEYNGNVITSTDEGNLCLWNANNGLLLNKFKVADISIKRIVKKANSKELLLINQEQIFSLPLWNKANLISYQKVSSPIHSLSFLDSYLLATHNENFLTVWRQQGERLYTVNVGKSFTYMMDLKLNRLIILSNSSYEIRRLDNGVVIKSGEKLFQGSCLLQRVERNKIASDNSEKTINFTTHFCLVMNSTSSSTSEYIDLSSGLHVYIGSPFEVLAVNLPNLGIVLWDSLSTEIKLELLQDKYKLYRQIEVQKGFINATLGPWVPRQTSIAAITTHSLWKNLTSGSSQLQAKKNSDYLKQEPTTTDFIHWMPILKGSVLEDEIYPVKYTLTDKNLYSSIYPSTKMLIHKKHCDLIFGVDSVRMINGVKKSVIPILEKSLDYKINNLCISEDLNECAHFNNRGKIYIWNGNTLSKKHTISTDFNDNVICMDGQGKKLFFASSLSKIEVFDLSNKKTIGFIDAKSTPRAIKSDHLGKILMVQGTDKNLYLHDCTFSEKNITVIKTYKNKSDPTSISDSKVKSSPFDLSSNGEYCLILDDDNEFSLFDVKQQKSVQTFQGHNDTLKFLAISQNNAFSLSVDAGNNVILWENKTGLKIKNLFSFYGDVHSLSFIHNGKTAVVGSGFGITFWETASGVQTGTLLLFNQNNDWLFFNNLGYFAASHNGKELIGFRNTKTLEFHGPHRNYGNGGAFFSDYQKIFRTRESPTLFQEFLAMD